MTFHHTLNTADISGSTSADRSGYGADGTLKNSPTIAASGHQGHQGQAITFNGTNQWIDFGNTASFSPGAGDFTALFWFKTTNINSWRGLQKRGTGVSGTAVGWQMSIVANGADPQYSNTVVSDASGNWANAPTDLAPHDNAWHMFSATFANASGLLKLYQDASALSASTNTGAPAGKNFDSTRNATFGCAWNDASTQSQFFSGTADELKFWKRCLSSTEIGALYAL
jgi:hypothetical protein